MARSLKQHFTDWCREQGDAEYDYGSNEGCALCTFLNDQGYAQRARAGGDYWVEAGAKPRVEHKLDMQIAMALVGEPHTFTALADRLSA